MARKIDTEALSDEALILLDDAIRKGQLTLNSGKLMVLEAGEVINTAKWVVQTLKAKKPKFLETPESLGLKPTVTRAGDAT